MSKSNLFRHARRFTTDKRGNVAMTFGLMFIPLIGMMGMAVDYSRWIHARSVTRNAMDTAVLAGGRALQLDNSDVAGALAVAQRYYEENVKSRIDVSEDTIAFVTANQATEITATGNAYIDTPLLSVIGVEIMPLLNENGAEYSVAKLAASGNAKSNLEVSMMLDITGSMLGDKLTAMQEAAKDLIDIVVVENQGEYTSKVALVPFAQAVNVGGTYFNPITNKNTNSTLADAGGAVPALTVPAQGSTALALFDYLHSMSVVDIAHAGNGRGRGRDDDDDNGRGRDDDDDNGRGRDDDDDNGRDRDDDDDDDDNGRDRDDDDDDDDNGRGRDDDDDDDDNGNGGDDNDNNSGGGSSSNYGPCAVDREGNDALTDAAPGPGTYVQAYDIAKQVNTHTRDMACRPGSVTILPLTNDKDALHAKIDSFTADGWTAGAVGTAFAWYMISPEWASIWPSESEPAAYDDASTKKVAILMTDGEYNTWYNGNGNGDASAQAVALCTNMKAEGITIYTVGFALGGNQTAIDTLASCATDSSMAYVAEDGNELKQAFRDIAITLSNLYLSK